MRVNASGIRLPNFPQMVGRCGPGSHRAARKGGLSGSGDSVDLFVRGVNERARHGNIGGGGVEVQVFGTQKHQETRRALRFWSERRVRVHFVDLLERAASKGELQRFVQKFGLTALIDLTSKRYAELGLAAARLSDERWMFQLIEEPLLLVQPLTRSGNRLSIGRAEAEWKAWVAEEKAK